MFRDVFVNRLVTLSCVFALEIDGQVCIRKVWIEQFHHHGARDRLVQAVFHYVGVACCADTGGVAPV